MTIGFLAYERFSGPLIRAMRTAGFDVSRLADSAPCASDEQVLAIAFVQNRILLTEDSDFGELVVQLRLPTHGVVRVALKSLAKADRGSRLVKGLTELEHKVRGAMVTIEPNRTRVRPLPGITDHRE
jgi:predicted nuclease of predicted toxin-antitoxin system